MGSNVKIKENHLQHIYNKQKKKEELTEEEIRELMDHDKYKRNKRGRIRQIYDNISW